MDPKKQRQHLREYTAAARDIELIGVAVNTLEGCGFRRTISLVIARLQAEQQRNLKRLDSAAAKLGAPYGA